MSRALMILALICLLAASALAAPDALDDALAQVGLARGDLGWVPKGWWPRYPDVPYKLRSFDRLFAAPLENVTYLRALAATADVHLDVAHLDVSEARGAGQLYEAVQRLGIDPRFGGFRGYSANTIAEPTPLDQAVLQLIQAAGRPTSFVTFGTASPYPQPQQDLAAMTAKLPPEVSVILGQLVLNVVDAHRWADLAWRRVDAKDREVVARRFNLGEELIDALDYCPEVDDVARAWDEASLWYAGLKCVQALDDARAQLAKLDLSKLKDVAWDWQTPWGWIRIRGTGKDEIDGTDALLIVDLGGNDLYRGGVAASTAERPLGLVLDLGGDDRYQSDVPAQGAGLCGCGILVDCAGNDDYRALHHAQGAGQFGLGVLIDLGGDDHYDDHFTGQGAAFFGVGLLLDYGGDDAYTLYSEGQGFGGPGGVGILADHAGSDTYEAVRSAKITGRPSYHSPGEDISVSNAQGCGMGRRADGGDGHAWAGGLGALLDGGVGNDVYTAGNWAHGTGYWFGIGYLHDAGGDDAYHGVCWSEATGAHFCIGTLIDEAGNDQHLSEATSRLSLAMGHDFTVAILVDGAGDDTYSVLGSGLGQSINRSVTMLLDLGGNDHYATKDIPRPGHAENNPSFRARPGVGTYFADTTSLGLFLDIGGDDTYWGDLVNDSVVLDPPDSPNWADRNFGIFVDRQDGTVDFTPEPMRPVSGTPR